MKQFDQRQDMQAVAEAAARLAIETAAATPEDDVVNPQSAPSTAEIATPEDENQLDEHEIAQQPPSLSPREAGATSATPVGISEDTRRLIQAATTEMIDRIMEERDELGAFRTQRMLDGIEPHTPVMFSDVMSAFGFGGLDYTDDSNSSSEGSVTSSQPNTITSSRSCPDLHHYNSGFVEEPVRAPRHVPTKSLGMPSTLRKRTVHREA